MPAAVGKRAATRPLLEVSGATLCAPGGRVLFQELKLALGRDRVAVVGRNGVGKSTLLRVLSGESPTDRVRCSSQPHLVPQLLSQDPVAGAEGLSPYLVSLAARKGVAADAAAAGLRALPELLLAPRLSHGELRKLRLLEAKWSGAEILFLDEPTDDLDARGVAWLRGWLRHWQGCLLVVSHDRRLLQDFRHFFVVRESGCRYFGGTLEEFDTLQDQEYEATETRYIGNLQRLAEAEARSNHLARRKARKKQYGRCRELKRCTSRMRLNQKRGFAQESQGRSAQIREARITAVREWSKASRRGLEVRLPLGVALPSLPEETRQRPLRLCGVSMVVEGRTLFEAVDLEVGRERVAVVGANGTGKTTLLEVLLERRRPTSGEVRAPHGRMGSIAQGGTDWMLKESLLSQLSAQDPSKSPQDWAGHLLAHKFPLALGTRPMNTLSPGERVRAALICLFQRCPMVDLLVLDEPTYSLDRFGQRALTEALRAWPGGLVVASHDQDFSWTEWASRDGWSLGEASPQWTLGFAPPGRYRSDWGDGLRERRRGGTTAASCPGLTHSTPNA